jgi:hypothetical protein
MHSVPKNQPDIFARSRLSETVTVSNSEAIFCCRHPDEAIYRETTSFIQNIFVRHTVIVIAADKITNLIERIEQQQRRLLRHYVAHVAAK